MPTEPRTTAMADPLTLPAQGSAEDRGALRVAGKRSVAKPPVSMQVGFYNIGWTDTQLSGQDHEMHRMQLGRECARALELNDLGMLCLCEVGTNKLDENLDAHLGNSAGFRDKYPLQDVNRWLERVIEECCTTSIDLEAYVLGPYAIVLNKSVCCFRSSPTLKGPLVTGTDHTYRRAVHSVIEVLPHGPLIEVWVHHAPSSKERKYTSHALKQTMHYFFEHVSNNGIVGGDLNMSPFGISTALRDWSSRKGSTQEDRNQLRRAWQIHMLREAQHGDLALTHGLKASQIEVTQQVKSEDTTKTHDLIVLQIDLEDLPPHERPSYNAMTRRREEAACIHLAVELGSTRRRGAQAQQEAVTSPKRVRSSDSDCDSDMSVRLVPQPDHRTLFAL